MTKVEKLLYKDLYSYASKQMNCATGKGVTVKAKDKRYTTREIRKLDGKTTSETGISSGYEIGEALVRQKQQQQGIYWHFHEQTALPITILIMLR